MISNDAELAATIKKLALLESERDALPTTETNVALRRSCHLGLSRLIIQFVEEVGRYRFGQREKIFLRRALRSEEEARNTRSKLEGIEKLLRNKLSNTDTTFAHRATVSSLRRTRNELLEEVLWFEAKARRSAVSIPS